MNSKLKKLYCLCSLGLFPFSALAAPTVTFQGEVTAQTCAVEINGQTNSVVLLPTVALTDFGATLAASQTAGLTPFTISVSGCVAPASAQNITTQFLGYDVDGTTGVLGNTNTSSEAASGFGIQLLSDSTGAAGTEVILNGVTDVPGLVLAAGETSASHEFGARYYSLGADGTAGKITAVAEYTVSYL
ncbi:TPA: type 1 fimbrial protein [Klebsiella quasipneumoniae subsp. quasipneumoniae]|nr:type 1 fimbrial protein [Klebsiella quasipneumoniae subsp. quasipneumoniae]